MRILEFHNREQVPLILEVEPGGARHEIPHLATAGLRYSLPQGVEDRCSSVMSEHRVEFWCSADKYEVEVVHPSPRDRLSWDICVNGGWCGGIVDNIPATFEDLLPEVGSITAEDFAILVVEADGWPEGEPMLEKHLRWLEAKFTEHLGAREVDAEVLRRFTRIPFEDTQP
jgi:hypothetical protein